jgi:hypothetical protein
MSAFQSRYRAFCAEQTDVSVFAQPWWLDAVCGADGWDVQLLEAAGQIQAALPYRKVKKWGLTRFEMPPLTPFFPLMVLNRQPSDRQQQLSTQKKAIEALLSGMPKSHAHALRLSPETEYALPFYWHGYALQERYTFRIFPEESYVPSAQARKNIRKAQELELRIEPLESTEALLQIVQAPFKRKKIKSPYTNEVIRRVADEIQHRGAGFLLQAKDKDGRVVSAAACVLDSRVCYLILGSSTEEGRRQNAEYLLYDACILKAQSMGLIFDFEGSMLEGIESRNRSFNAKPVRYTQVQRNGLWYSLLLGIKGCLGR